ncbi:MAG: ATP-binding cassette domain-containing protein [Chthoniobacterales bacterium]
MLQLKDVTLFIGSGENVTPLLADIGLSFPRGHFVAIIGPSGCGKSTLLKVIAGVAQGEEEGTLSWNGRDLSEQDFSPSEIGYVPQFSIAHDDLTALECVEYAMALRVASRKGVDMREECEKILDKVSLREASDRLVRVLSGGQKRRLALAMELVSAPAMLLADEVTSGLDPNSEDEIVRLLADIAHEGNRLVLSVTHSLQNLELYDSVVVLYKGAVTYHGPPQFLMHYFQVDNPQKLYRQLAYRDALEWSQSWNKHKEAFLEGIQAVSQDEQETEEREERLDSITFDSEESESSFVAEEIEIIEEVEIPQETPLEEESATEKEPAEEEEFAPIPGAISQFRTLLGRRIRILFRNRMQLYLQLGLIFGFPLLVAIFAWNGLPQIKNLSMGLDLNVIQQLVEAKDFLLQASKVGSLVSGIVMFQVVLLTLMGANNSGREIAAERLILEKEKLSGVRAASYVASKAAFLSILVLAQSLWMGLFVHFVCQLPGDLLEQLLLLLMVNAAMTSICLGISSWMSTAEQASLVSIYLVGFQLPLSGAVLALPEWLGQITRPFIAAYWSWSGVLQTLRGERYYDIVKLVAQTQLSSTGLCLWVLVVHVLVGLFIAWIGCQRTRWE